MSSPPLRRDDRLSIPDFQTGLSAFATGARSHIARLPSTVARPARAIAFWLAIALPFLNSAFFVRGLATPAEAVAFLGLLATNLVALWIGHPHGHGS
jgi:uncharacterized membrane protein YphA (DoxX/SURF4 family)